MEKRREVEELLSMFHDFELIGVSRAGDVLSLNFVIPWGQVWEPTVLDYQIKVKFFGCEYLKCEYYTFKEDKANISELRALRETEDRFTTDTAEIALLGLEVQHTTFQEPNLFTLHCNSSKNIAGGKITFSSHACHVLDSNDKHISLKQLKLWSTKWWGSIEHMWAQKKS